MRILVAMKQVPDVSQIRMSNRKPVMEGVDSTYGELDKSALEAAVQYAEAHEGTKVTVIGAGDEELEETVKEALAMGADDALIACDDSFASPKTNQSAVLVAALAKEAEDADLILMGEGSGDNFSGLVPGMVAEILGWPAVGGATSFSVEGETATVTRNRGTRVEKLEVCLPAVVAVSSDIATPRAPAISKILKASRKPKGVLDSDDLDVELPAPTVDVLEALAPENNRDGEVLGSIDELIDYLRGKNLL